MVCVLCTQNVLDRCQETLAAVFTMCGHQPSTVNSSTCSPSSSGTPSETKFLHPTLKFVRENGEMPDQGRCEIARLNVLQWAQFAGRRTYAADVCLCRPRAIGCRNSPGVSDFPLIGRSRSTSVGTKSA